MTVMDRTKPDGDAALVEALRREDPEAPEQLVEKCGHPTHAKLDLQVTAVSGCAGFEPAKAQA